MGTPEFAVPGLKILVEHDYQVVGVVTAPDKPQGRGLRISQTPVKEYAESVGLHILQPEKLKDPLFIEELKSLNADLQIVVAFRMLPEIVWDMPRLGTFNLHASLLPQYRGAAPINWAIINGEKETGVTTFFLKHEIDTGDLILQEREPIFEDDTAGTLYDRLMLKGADLIIQTVQMIENKKVNSIPQENLEDVKHAPKIFKGDCLINWNNSAEDVRNFIRGMAPYPTAYTTINNLNCKLFNVSIVSDVKLSPGVLKTDQKNYIFVGTHTNAISIEILQLEGKKKMTVKEFLLGNKVYITE